MRKYITLMLLLSFTAVIFVFAYFVKNDLESSSNINENLINIFIPGLEDDDDNNNTGW